MSHQRYLFSVNMNYALCQDLYRHHVKYLLVESSTGKRIQLPKHNMQKFVTPIGIKGEFALIVDENNKIIEIYRL